MCAYLLFLRLTHPTKNPYNPAAIDDGGHEPEFPARLLRLP